MEKARADYEKAFKDALEDPSDGTVARLLEASDRMSRIMGFGKEAAA